MSKVLIVDDDQNFRETLVAQLIDAGLDAVGESSAESAVQGFDDADYDAVIVDALLPKMNGFDFLKTIARRGFEGPRVFVSGIFKSGSHQDQAREVGATAFMAKPLDIERLIAALSIERKAPAPKATQRPMPPSGQLLEAPVFHLLWRAEREVHSGVLDVFRADGERGRLFVFRGELVLAQSTHPELNIGIELVRQGVLTAEMLQQAIDKALDIGDGLHPICKKEGWIQEKTAKAAYRSLMPRIVARLAAAAGTFRWTDGEDYARHVPSAPTSITDTLSFAMSQAAESDLKAHLDPRGKLRLAPGKNWDELLPMLAKATGSDAVARGINGRASIAQLIGAGSTQDDRVQRMRQVFILMVTQSVKASKDVIKMTAAAEVPAAPAPTPVAAQPSSSPAPRAVAAPSTPAPRPTPAPTPAPTPTPSTPTPAQAAAPAAQMLKNTDSAALDKGVAFTPEDEAARARIDAKYTAIKGADLWTVLGVEQNAGAAEVKKAYFALARDFHADTFSGLNLGSSRPRLDELFALMGEAYATLTDDNKRGEYEAKMQMEAEGMTTDIGALFEAERNFDKGKALLDRGEMVGASKYFEMAVEAHSGNVRWTAYLAYTAWWKDRSPGKVDEILHKLEDAAKDTPSDHDIPFYQGRILVEIGNDDGAKRFFKRVLRAKGKHAGAERYLRQLNEAAEKANKKGLGRFFKR